MRFVKALVALSLSLGTVSPAFAGGDTLVIKGIKVDGGAMSFLGTTITWVNDEYVKNKYLGYAGWGLIIGGLVIGSGSTSNAQAKEVDAKAVWNSVRSEARLAASGSQLLDDSSAIVAAANQSQVPVSTLASLTGEVDRVTSQARASGQTLSVDQVVSLVNPAAKYQKLTANMAQVALIAQ
ncbi:MAG: hypothetical protein JNJ49_08560 [Bdellovibrionaceae bacterium]|nr:hypothetical protein [Pseudobdellovibrionaceae bacterium]